jgi:redox-sensitive bicupin YhaK (pirin superfamily)
MKISPLGFPWECRDPFLFCAYHDDAYPAGNDVMGPAASLAGRRLGNDFERRDGWSMYHGEVVPGFPQHPHRGFETVTWVRSGIIDHSDSLGATARFGRGDVQWLTAGGGIVHAEMFPLLDRNGPNPLELFQIWLNLPRAKKMVEPHFSMLWADQIPRLSQDGVEVSVVAGALGSLPPPSPPPKSWAAEAEVVIWTIRLAPGAKWVVPAGPPRSLYFFRGRSLRADGSEVEVKHRIDLDKESLALENGDVESELLVLGGRPIGEPVVSYGPFVMNSPAEIQQAMADYRRTEFGGWPWPTDDPVHPRQQGRFARHADGRIEKLP